MNRKKLLYLFLALLLPVVVFLFLKSFGRNEFNVPVMHQDSIPALSSDCGYRYEVPYRIPDSVMSRIRGNSNDSLYVLYFDSSANAAIARVRTEFGADPIKVVDENLSEDGAVLRKCILLMDDNVSVALVDHRNRIRGYYDPHDREDMDRLIVEVKIILKKY
jgi:hypothetical protein